MSGNDKGEGKYRQIGGGPMRRAGIGRGPMHGGMGMAEKAKDFRGTLKKIIRYLKPYLFSLIIVVLFAAAVPSFP